MAKNIIAFICLLFLYCSCYKANNVRLPATTPVFNMFMQTGGGISVSTSNNIITINDSLSYSTTIIFSIISGNPENYPVTCFISGLPAGISLTSPDSVTFKLSSSVEFNFSVATADTGIFTYYVNVRTPDSLKSYPVRVHVLPVPDGAPQLVGAYSGQDNCWHFSSSSVPYSYTATIDTVPGQHHWISIRNYRGLGDSVVVYASVTIGYIIDPSSGTIDIPLQTTGGYTIYGRGTGSFGIYGQYNRPYISIERDTVIHAGDSVVCNTTLYQS